MKPSQIRMYASPHTMNRLSHTPNSVNTATYEITATTPAMIVPETMPLPTPVRIDASTTGISVIGAVSVIAARAAPTTIGQRSIGRSQKYTSVLSSRRSPIAAPPNTSATTGTTTAKPRLAISCTASSRSGVALAEREAGDGRHEREQRQRDDPAAAGQLTEHDPVR